MLEDWYLRARMASLMGKTTQERLPIIRRDLGACELYPQMLKHNYNGRFVAVCGDEEFIIYTAQALRNKTFGQTLDFVWSGTGTGDYAIRETINRVKVFKNFKESKTIKPATSSSEGLFGGHLIGVKGGDSSVLFYDWDSGEFIRKIDVAAKEVYWSDSGNMVCIATSDGAYVLSYNAQAAAPAIAMGQVSPEDGIDGTFDLLYEINDNVSSGKWVGDCFIYMNNNGRLNYTVSVDKFKLLFILRHQLLVLQSTQFLDILQRKIGFMSLINL